MRFLDFKQKFSQFNGIKYQDIKNCFSEVNQSQLSLWKKRGYIKSVRKGMYALSDTDIDNLLLANEMNHSYISMEFALSYYQIIPEITPSITCVSNNRSESVVNEFGNFYYHKITPKLFLGFALLESSKKEKRFIRIAEREKALFDLVYFRSDLKAEKDFHSLRLNIEKKIDFKKIKEYIELVEAPQTRKRLDNFVKYLDAFIK
jgi:predicted transcriptional regulator of viral defense system